MGPGRRRQLRFSKGCVREVPATLGADSIEHGSVRDEVPDAAIAEMKAKGIALDPTLSVAEGLSDFAKGKTDLLKR